MGLFKDVKASTIGAEARRAIEVGRRVFTPMLVIPGSKPSMSGAIDDWAVMIDAIEAEGWTLDRFTVSGDKPVAYCLFRRAAKRVPTI
jgi:hypothetical protein